jgi:hypothetical protein
MLNAEVPAYVNDFAIFIFEFLRPLVTMSCQLDGQPAKGWSRPLKDQFPFLLAPEFCGS